MNDEICYETECSVYVWVWPKRSKAQRLCANCIFNIFGDNDTVTLSEKSFNHLLFPSPAGCEHFLASHTASVSQRCQKPDSFWDPSPTPTGNAAQGKIILPDVPIKTEAIFLLIFLHLLDISRWIWSSVINIPCLTLCQNFVSHLGLVYEVECILRPCVFVKEIFQENKEISNKREEIKDFQIIVLF